MKRAGVDEVGQLAAEERDFHGPSAEQHPSARGLREPFDPSGDRDDDYWFPAHVECVDGVASRIAGLADRAVDLIEEVRRELAADDRPAVVDSDQDHAAVRV